jgi:hypothetical protein
MLASVAQLADTHCQSAVISNIANCIFVMTVAINSIFGWVIACGRLKRTGKNTDCNGNAL